MDSAYEVFCSLLENKKVTAYQVAKATGISSTVFSDWKSGKSKPKYDKLMKLSDYFNVDVSCFGDYAAFSKIIGKDISQEKEITDDELLKVFQNKKNQPIQELTDEEIEIINMFRKLNKFNKEIAHSFMKNAITVQEKYENAKNVQFAALTGEQGITDLGKTLCQRIFEYVTFLNSRICYNCKC